VDPAAQAAQEAQVAPGEQEPAPVAPPDLITIIVTPQDAVTLNYLLYSGAELTLALRASGDDSVISTEAATLQFMLDVYSIPVPAKLPYGTTPRIEELVPPDSANGQSETEQ